MFNSFIFSCLVINFCTDYNLIKLNNQKFKIDAQIFKIL